TISFFTEVLIRFEELSEKIIFHSEKAYQNIIDNEGLDNSELVMMKISDKLGKFDSHQIIHDVAVKYQMNKNQSYLDSLLNDKRIAENFSREEVTEWLKPENYYGLSDKLAEKTYERVQKLLKEYNI